eukprot:CAMPEP_0114596038 /NCGR_PEP_ID=MMETSP0125-20121206/17979_1 /TAXON_ID=485358 ORGANISM="Aristerostoma sp., Strain ATCC 50986" /NCGR_SAMPLE_ID=MMETSP0125 /ASSEMBLY_ACC=CAM_ASM_000245 /LENGTH=129 /DNA_ID=CAMNT_0001798511 /DNA_START=556 /DNA_END=945 /DNA_ORIENTATION=+
MAEIMKQRNMQEQLRSEMMDAQEKMKHDKMQQLAEKYYYHDMIKQNESKQALKEMNYKNFYQHTAEAQKHAEDMHVNQVLSPQMKRKNDIDQFIDKGVKDENERKLRDEVNRLKNRYEQYQDMNRTLKV